MITASFGYYEQHQAADSEKSIFKNRNELLQKAWESFRDLLIKDKQKPLDVFVEVEYCYV